MAHNEHDANLYIVNALTHRLGQRARRAAPVVSTLNQSATLAHYCLAAILLSALLTTIGA